MKRETGQQGGRNMSKIIGILCIAAFVCVFGWAAYATYMGVGAGGGTGGTMVVSEVGEEGNSQTVGRDMVHIGDVSASEGAVLKVENGELKTVGGGQLSVTGPLVQRINLYLLGIASLLSLAAGILLVRKRPA